MTLPGPRDHGRKTSSTMGGNSGPSSQKLGPSFLPAAPRNPSPWHRCGLKNIIFSRSVRNVSLEFHMTHGQRDGQNGIEKILRMMKFDVYRRGKLGLALGARSSGDVWFSSATAILRKCCLSFRYSALWIRHTCFFTVPRDSRHMANLFARDPSEGRDDGRMLM